MMFGLSGLAEEFVVALEFVSAAEPAIANAIPQKAIRRWCKRSRNVISPTCGEMMRASNQISAWSGRRWRGAGNCRPLEEAAIRSAGNRPQHNVGERNADFVAVQGGPQREHNSDVD